MHDTGSVSTFEKHVLADNILTEKQMAAVGDVQNFLRSVGIQKSQEEVAMMLKFLDPKRMAQIIADIRAQWKIALPKPRVFTLSPDKDEALQKKLVAQGPEMAQKIVECRKIQEALEKFGIHLTVSEIVIHKGYYAPPELQPQGPVLRAAPDTGELPAARDEEPAPPASAPKKPSARKRVEEAAPPAPPDEGRARKQKIVFLASLGGLAACAILVVAVALFTGGNKPKKPEKPVAAETPRQAEPAPAKQPAEPPPKLTPLEVPPLDPPAPPEANPVAPPAPKPEEPPAPAPAPPTPAPPKDEQPIPPPAEPTPEPEKPAPEDPAPATETPEKPASPQDLPEKPKDAKSAKAAKREAEAQKLWDDAQKLMKASQWEAALDSLRVLRERYRFTAVYTDKSREIREALVDCGYKMAATGLAKQVITKKLHIDAILGFQLNPPEGWRGIPNWQDWAGHRDTSEAKWRGESYRCARYTSRWLESLYFNIYKTYAPVSDEDVCEGWQKITRREYKGLKEISAAPFPHPKYKALKKTYLDEDGNRFAVYAYFDPASKKGFGIIGYWKASEEDDGWVVVTSAGTTSSDDTKKPCDEKDWETAVKVFDSVARTFVIMDQGTLASTRIAAKGWGISPDGWCVKCADWSVHNTANYTIEYATRKEFAERLGKELENILALYKKVIPSAKGVARGRVKLFDCEGDFQYYGQAPGAAAYWSPWQREIVAYRFEGRKVKIGEKDANEEMTIAEEKNPEEVTFNIIYHEAFHQYMDNIMGITRDVYVPSWLNEGMGDYFFGGQWNKQGKLEIGLNDWRLETIVKAVKENKHVPLKKILYYQQRDYYSNAGLCYAEGWSICYFFMSEEGRKKGYHLIPPAMFDSLKKIGDEDAKRSTDKVFAGIDIDEMERLWKAFVLGLEKHLPKKPAEDEKPPEPKKRR